LLPQGSQIPKQGLFEKERKERKKSGKATMEGPHHE
jgi:hypothetical protein